MNVNTMKSTFLALLSVVLLSACMNLERPYPERRYYLLRMEREGERREPTAGAVLRVSHFNVSPAFQTRELAYMRDENRGETDFYNQFYLSPDSMITTEARNWLSDSGLFENVVPSNSLVEAGYILEGSIVALFGDYRKKTEPIAHLELQVLLLRDDPRGVKVLLQKDYNDLVPLSEASPEALVEGLRTALRTILESLEEDIASVDLTPDS